jgi:hypothetical protein
MLRVVEPFRLYRCPTANVRVFAMICFEKISLLLCPGGDFLPDPHDFVASLLGEGA